MVDANNKQDEKSLSPRLRVREQLRNLYPIFEWEGVFSKYARGWVKRHQWRVSHLWPTEEDSLQEAAIVFLRCQAKYQGKIKEAKHFMALFKIALVNEWNVASSKDTKRRDTARSSSSFMFDRRGVREVEQDRLLLARGEVEYSAGPLAAILAGCNQELKTVFTALANAPSEVMGIFFLDANMEGINRRVKRICGIKRTGERNLIKEIKELLTE